jgi:hypothetical protein
VRSLLTVLLGSALLVCRSPLAAHHGAAGLFVATPIEMKGVVTDWRLVNPHPILRVEVTETGGDKAIWEISFGASAASALRRQGFTPATFKIGETLVVKGYPARAAGVKGLNVSGGDGKVTRADGAAIP